MSNKVITTDQISFWMNGAGKKKLLTKEEVCLIARKVQSNPKGSLAYKQAVNKLVSHNLRLVIRSVNLFMKTKTVKNWGETETLDFLQVGAMGLIRAAEKFDPSMGYSFSTYATFWIRSFVSRYNIKISSIFHIPENACRDAYAYEKHGAIGKKTKEDSKAFAELVRSAQSAISLDAKMRDDDDGGLTFADTLQIEYSQTIPSGTDYFSDEMENIIKLAGLSDQQAWILRCLFVHELKIKEIMELTKLSNGQIQEIRKDAFRKIKATISMV
jgi:RNA polymerase primary sigma factor